MRRDLKIQPNSTSLANSTMYLSQSLGFNDVWITQGVENVNIFISLVK